MCYKSPWGRGREKRRPSTLAGGSGDGLEVSSRAGSILARRPTSRAIGLQLKIVARSSQISLCGIGHFFSGPDLILGLCREIDRGGSDAGPLGCPSARLSQSTQARSAVRKPKEFSAQNAKA